MQIAYELSGEHPTLPRADALAALEAEGVVVSGLEFSPGLLIVRARRVPKHAVTRVALSRYASRVLATGSRQVVIRRAGRADLDGARFRVRASGLAKAEEKRGLERIVGAEFAKSGTVDLEEPQRDFRLLPRLGGFLLLEVLHAVERQAFESRKVARRPFSLPISLHPKYARALVNLSRCPAGGTLLDPFCGTGGIVMEAARLGIRVIASDVEEKMTRGTAATLAHYGLRAKVFTSDIGAAGETAGPVDAIATDPPYGRATTTRHERLDHLYRRTFDTFARTLRPGGHAAVVLPSEDAVRVGAARLELVETHALRVHASLTRTFCAFVRGP